MYFLYHLMLANLQKIKTEKTTLYCLSAINVIAVSEILMSYYKRHPKCLIHHVFSYTLFNLRKFSSSDSGFQRYFSTSYIFSCQLLLVRRLKPDIKLFPWCHAPTFYPERPSYRVSRKSQVYGKSQNDFQYLLQLRLLQYEDTPLDTCSRP